MRSLVRSAAVAAALAGLAAVPATVLAQEIGAGQTGGVIRQIVVEGNQRIEPETVRSYMAVAEGDQFDPARLDQSLKSLFATGLFADVAMRRAGDSLVVRVVENPIINRIAFEGNQRIDDTQLDAETQLRPRVVYTRAKVQSDVQRILDLYRRSGRYAVTVDPKIIELDQNRVDLVFEINEGSPTYVRRITFIGNSRYGDGALREEIATKEERWYRFLSSADTYDPDRLTYDRELLRRFYLRNGYADFRVTSAVAELTPDREAFFITFTMDEGERYRFGSIDVNVSLPDLDPESLKGQIVPSEGDWYNADEVERTVQNLTDAIGARGYAFVDVRPRVSRDPENRRINVTFDIQEGPRVFVRRIEINGNVRTLDKVIRREFRLVEGDAFNTAKLRRSRERIRNLGFFEKVEVNNVPAEDAPDQTDIIVDVEERATGELSFGVGWSSSVGALFEAGIRERNLLGKGQDLKLNLRLAQRQTEVDLSFTEPYFLDRPLRAGFDVFHITNDYQKTSSYDSTTTGGALRLGWSYNEFLGHQLKYTLQQTEIRNVDDDASRYIREQEGRSTLSQIGHTLTYDKRDSVVEPTDGYVVSLANSVAGLGGSEAFIRNDLSGAYYVPLADRWTVRIGGNVGYIYNYDDDPLGIAYRYNLGGENLRGFAYGGAGARDGDDALGGNWIANGSVELRLPLGLPEELGVTGKIFTDFGVIGEPDLSGGSYEYASSIRASVGVGLIWKSPVGPINIDLAQPVLKEDFDETELFRLNFGTRF
ncbi:outer membrane protein assembly factor BamA [Caenispirillum bisanense]|uniref:outer membrane protein assembly factor BamA n=1 Tax=Caenispirillum bisanense TaxID=414052 RepID=UPI0031D6DCF3